MWREAITIVWLAALSICDTRRKRVPVWLLCAGAVLAVGFFLCSLSEGETNILKLCRAFVPGAVFLVIAAATGKAGTADGIILIIMGVLEGYEGCLTACLGGLILISLFSAGLLMTKRVKRNTKIPFVPFLTAGWLIAACGKWSVL